MNFGTMLDGWMDGYAVIISVDSDFSVSHLFELPSPSQEKSFRIHHIGNRARCPPEPLTRLLT